MPKPLGGHHMVLFGEYAVAVIGGQSNNLTIQDEIHVFRRVFLVCHKIRDVISEVLTKYVHIRVGY